MEGVISGFNELPPDMQGDPGYDPADGFFDGVMEQEVATQGEVEELPEPTVVEVEEEVNKVSLDELFDVTPEVIETDEQLALPEEGSPSKPEKPVEEGMDPELSSIFEPFE